MDVMPLAWIVIKEVDNSSYFMELSNKTFKTSMKKYFSMQSVTNAFPQDEMLLATLNYLKKKLL